MTVEASSFDGGPIAIGPSPVALPSQSLERRFLRASGAVTIGNVASRLISLLIGIATARLLTEQEFGAFGLVQSTLGMFGIAAGLSLGTAATRYVALYRSTDPRRVQGVVAIVLGIGTISTILTALALGASAPWLATHVLGQPSLVVPLRWAAVQLAFTAAFWVVGGILSGMERFALLGISAVIQNVVILAASFALIRRFGVAGAVGAQALGLLVTLLFGLWFVRELFDGMNWRSAVHEARRESRMLFEFCLPSILSGLVNLPAAWACSVLIANQPGGYAELAFFTAADRFRLLLMFVAGFVGTALLPILAGSSGSESTRSDGKRGVELGLLATAVLIVPLTGLLAFGGPAVMAAFGKSYQTNWSVLLPVIAWGAAGAIGSVVGTALLAHGRQWFLFFQQTIYGLTILALTYMLRRLGSSGLALAQLGAVLLLLGWSYPIILRLGVMTPRSSRLLFGLTAAVCAICGLSWVCPSAWRLALALPVACVCVPCAFLTLTTAERARIVMFIRARSWTPHGSAA